MTERSPETIEHLEELIRIRRQRLRLLDEQLAKNAGNPSAIAQLTSEREEEHRELKLLVAELRRLRPEPLSDSSPYLGLLTFQEANADLFFGRDELIADLVERVRRAPFLAVLGASGSGKSSLVRAGLIPILKAGALPGSETWHYITLKPGARPLDTLAAELAKLQQADLSQALSLSLQLAENDRAFLMVVELLLDRSVGQRLVLVVDQFEELWTLAPLEGESRDAFLNQQQRPFIQRLLSAIAAPDKPLLLVVTMRADFLHRAAEDPALAHVIGEHDLIVSPMSAAELRKVIVRPAELAGGDFEPGLVDELIEQGQQGALPLLEYTLAELWKKRLPNGRMTWDAYRALGGVEGALAARADALLEEHYQLDRRDELRKVLLRMVQPGEGAADTRRRVPIDQLTTAAQSFEDLYAFLQPLIDERLLTTGPDANNGKKTIEVSHEALIRSWPTLRRWIDEDRADLRFQLRLEEAAQEWQANDQNAGLLWSGLRLSNAEAWVERAKPRLNDPDQAFLDVSRVAEQARIDAEEAVRQRELAQAKALVEEQRLRAEEQAHAGRRLRQRAFLLSAALVVALITAAGAGWFSIEARRSAEAEQAQRAEAEAARVTAVAASQRAEREARISLARQLAAQAERDATSRPYRTLLLGVQANHFSNEQQTRSALLSVLTENERLIGFISAYSGVIYSVTFSPDGRILAFESEDNTIRLWDVTNRQPIGEALQGHTSFVHSLAFSPDGKILASGSWDNTIQLWDVNSQRRLGAPLQGHTKHINSVAFSPDGTILASASVDSTVRLWDVTNQQQLGKPLQGHTDSVWSIAFSPDGATLASAGGDRTIRLWDVVSRQALDEPLQGHRASVRSIVFSPDGKTLASASWDNTIRLWDVASQKMLGKPLQFHTSSVQSVVFSPDGKTLASAGDDTVIRLWDLDNRRTFGELRGHTEAVWSVVFSPDGETLASASGDGSIRLWDMTSRTLLGETLQGHTRAIRSVVFNPDGRILASASEDQTIRLWNITSRDLLGEVLQAPINSSNSVTFRPDGMHLGSINNDNSVQVRDVVSGQGLDIPFQDYNISITSVAFSPDGRILASANENSTIQLWDIASRKSLGEALQGHSASVNSIAFSPNGRIMASASADSTIWLWDINTRRSLGEALQGHSASVNSIAFSPNGRILASGSSDGTIRLWDVASRQLMEEPLYGHTGPVQSVVFSRDGKILASASWDYTIRLWDVASWRPLGDVLHGHTSSVQSVAFSPNDMTLASVSWDKTIRLWDVSSQQPLGEPLQGHSDYVYSVVFSPDGTVLASASRDKTIRLWDVSPQSWQERACRIAGRNLSMDEWVQFIGSERPYERTCPQFPPGEGAPPTAQ